MQKLLVAAEAPANIALIKYMGKVAPQDGLSETRNRPTNASLSLTLPKLLTRVELWTSDDVTEDLWQPLEGEGWLAPTLSEKGTRRYLQHFALLKKSWGFDGHFIIRSANNFPADCGLASSASSFAALTLAAAEWAQKNNPTLDLTLSQIAELSRQGSGSSIRSFYQPFCEWNAGGAHPVDLGDWDLEHFVVVVEKEKKQVSSSDAHLRVVTSSLFTGRPERAEQRLQDLKLAFHERNWKRIYQICWDEFHDMHALFSTSVPPFSYMADGTHVVLQELEEHWRRRGDGPIVTMDAGPNVHLLFRKDQQPLRRELMDKFATRFAVFGAARGPE